MLAPPPPWPSLMVTRLLALVGEGGSCCGSRLLTQMLKAAPSVSLRGAGQRGDSFCSCPSWGVRMSWVTTLELSRSLHVLHTSWWPDFQTGKALRPRGGRSVDLAVAELGLGWSLVLEAVLPRVSGDRHAVWDTLQKAGGGKGVWEGHRGRERALWHFKQG